MFSKILIANRGEIACRVMTTARKLGVRTVAIYSDADAHVKHVAMADQTVHIGAAPVADSYLRADVIIEAALKTGAEAIHPGYGFLSENPDFVEAVDKAGLTFIGPSANAIRAMGLKDAAKVLMEKAGVPVVPGYHGDNQEPDFLANEAEKIGYPVLIKARAGGGGKGMRLVGEASQFQLELLSAQREAQSSFGDPVCLIEKYINKPRHIEIQIFGDQHGNVVHLFERDCSLQRRHQKVIEEAPAPAMPPKVREAMGKAAVEAGKAIGYSGAGTVEFIVDGSRELSEHGFWFMEMNTRLQVEHPVSEAITGLDFVELQLRVASGEELPFAQDDLTIDGWSFEARLYAEDVPAGFLPATGTLDHLVFPKEAEFALGPARIDSGVREGDEISPFYDPMIAKVIVHGATRDAALTKLSCTLQDCEIAGCTTNLEFLSALSKHRGFVAGDVDTGLIGRNIDLLSASREQEDVYVFAAAIAALGLLDKSDSRDPWSRFRWWRNWSVVRHQITLLSNDEEIVAGVEFSAPGSFTIDLKGGHTEIRVAQVSEFGFEISTGDTARRLSIRRTGSKIHVFDQGAVFSFRVKDPFAGDADHKISNDEIAAPMPGRIVALSAEAGQAVKAGEVLLVLEAMKMEHKLTAPHDRVIDEVFFKQGEQVPAGVTLVKLRAEDGG